MTGLKLYTYPNNPRAFKALIAAKYVGVQIEVPEFAMGTENKSSKFLKLNPAGKVPVLETPEGGVFESNAIARYVAGLADTGLKGTTDYEQALIDQWVDFATLELDAPFSSWLYPIVMPNVVPYNKQREEAAQAAIKKAFTALEAHLKSHTFLVGQRVTLADIVACCSIFNGITKLTDDTFLKPFPGLKRWFLTLAHQPEFAAVMGPVQLCSSPLKYTPQKKEQAPKKDKAAQQPKKEAAPAAAATPAATAGEEEDTPAAPHPKPKNPLDALPPSKMALDSWKRMYSNTPAKSFREVAIKALWEGGDVPRSQTNEHFEGYDPEGYSMWFCDYKYPEENTVNFIVMNKVGGFLQRLDYVRKYAFGVISILKNESGEFPVKGLWIFRGSGIPPIMLDECVDLELYEWTKVNLSDPKQKALVEDMIVEEDKIAGLELVDTKVFK
ncbi:hypothetical protein WJX73_009454 [Symbiochloris irregularis]|uniref:Elongation factor 1-gamma n=1 Tax=Symbiochloris irregularis TaxID=706552 RepID=A0AAW1NW64_9CHLO